MSFPKTLFWSLVACVGMLASAAVAQPAAPRLNLTQVGVHFICSADGQPDMYSWRMPTKDTAEGASRGSFFIPVIADADLESYAMGQMPIVSGGRTALKVKATSDGSGPNIEHKAIPGYFDGNAQLTNLEQVHWRSVSAPQGQLKDRFYSNFPPLRNPSSAGKYSTTGIPTSSSDPNYSRYYLRHPGYDWRNWNWTLDFDTPLQTSEKRVQARLHLELNHPKTLDATQPFDFTLIFDGAEMSSIEVNGRPVFSQISDVVLKLSSSHFSEGVSLERGGYISAQKMTSGRYAGYFSSMPEDSGYDSGNDHVRARLYNLELLSSFFTIQRNERLNVSSGSIAIKVYEGHVNVGTTANPIQTIRFRLNSTQMPAPDLVVAGSLPVNYVPPTLPPMAYVHPAVQAPHWWVFHRDGALGRFDNVGNVASSDSVPGRMYRGGPQPTLPALSAVDPRTSTQRVPGVRALFYGYDEQAYPDVKRYAWPELVSSSTKRIEYLPPDYDTPAHFGTDSLRMMVLNDPLVPVADSLDSAFVPQSQYGNRDVNLLPGFADAQPVITQHPESVANVNAGLVRLNVAASSLTPVTFQWRFKGVPIQGATSNLLHLTATSGADAGAYDAVVTNAKGSVTSNPAVLTMADPVIFGQPSSASVFVGEKAVFSVTVEGTGLKYQWRRDGLVIPGATGRVLTLAKTKLADQGDYDVVITGSNGTRVSAHAELTLKQSLAILQQPLGGKMRQGGQVILKVKAVGEMPLAYQWRRNGEPVPQATIDRLALEWTTDGSVGGSYDVVVTDPSGSVTSAKAEVTLLNSPPAISNSPDEQTVTVGDDVDFSIAATGTDLSYQWRRNGVNLAKTNTSNIILKAVKKADEGLYDCVVSNGNGAVISDAARLTVLNPALYFTMRPTDSIVLVGGATQFASLVEGSQTGVTYQWSLNGKPIAGAVYSLLDLPVVDPAMAGIYTVTATRGKDKVSASAQLVVSEFGLLIYKLAGTGQTILNGTTTRVAVSGYLVANRLSQEAALIVATKDGRYTRFEVQRLEGFRYSSTGTAAGSQAVFSAMNDAGQTASLELRSQLWLQGTEGVVKLSSFDQTRAAKTLSGQARRLSLQAFEDRERMLLETISLTATLDLPGTAQARLNQESLEEALERLSLDLVTKGQLEMSREEP